MARSDYYRYTAKEWQRKQAGRKYSHAQRAAYWKAKYLACRADLTAHQRVNSRRWKKR